MNAIILCGGIGSRLGDLTKKTPKVLMEIGGRTVFDWQMQKIKNIGLDEVVLSAGHLSDVLKKQVGSSWNGIKIKYAVEPERLGTGGGIKYAMNYIKNENRPTFVLNGDVLTTVNLQEMQNFLDEESDGIILGTKVEDTASYGTLVYKDNYQIKEFKEKEGKNEPGFINGGIYLFTRNIKQYFPDKDKFSIEYDVFPNIEELYVYESDKPWIDIGVPERLKWAQKNWEIFEE